ncbi:dihydroorotate dehydrogenase [Caldisphaera lagunensis DSM 15908]|uniref:Dihydroorotate dehydrogenase n=1 Tax=Caldisphaera lagunensis (strain DSM 15908 / JCM 11604 / ANMR 0165 / IC-154) TaxID=1056495 RepID=L0ABC6_CALLD|nr:dihydroorotate dehydrogenase [Caldisphaera lagunensis]AFZ70355.1 dihydroorotate dehydrogenase [Caldisphaera lagunensis DSM 15908]
MSIAESMINLISKSVKYVHPEITMRIGHLIFSIPLPEGKCKHQYEIGSAKVCGKVGIAAGLDKNGKYAKFLSHFNPGFIVIGSTTPKKRIGNKPPRVARILPYSMVNAMGLNNDGLPMVLSRVSKINYPIFISVAGFNLFEIEEQIIYLNKYMSENIQGIEINLSSPTYKGKWKDIIPTLTASKKQIFIKIGPGFSIREYAKIANKEGFGLVLSNTLPIQDNRISVKRGGLSGILLYKLSKAMIKKAREVGGNEIPIIGVGGIMSCKQLNEILQYANAAEIYTAILYMGPGIINSLNERCNKL